MSLARFVTPKLRPAIKTHGGKNYLARRIVSHFPPHDSFVEACLGGGSVLLNKPRCVREVANDLNVGLIAFYEVLRDRTQELLEHLEGLPYTEEVFAWSKEPSQTDGPIEAAVRLLVRNRFSRGGLGEDFAWSDRLRGGRPGDLNAWETIKQELPRIARRFCGVELRCQDELEVIRELDGRGVLHYVDPTYLPSTRTARNTYEYEMTEADHVRLLEVITGCRGMVIISGYPSRLYDEALVGWERVKFNMPNHAGQGRTKQRRTEVLWLNPQCRRGRILLRG
jgi:DNA adenine methylase